MHAMEPECHAVQGGIVDRLNGCCRPAYPKTKSYVQRIVFPENFEMKTDLESCSFELAEKISVHMAEALDMQVLNAIAKTARENGITDLLVLDKQFVLDALREKLERMKEDEHGKADDRV